MTKVPRGRILLKMNGFNGYGDIRKMEIEDWMYDARAVLEVPSGDPAKAGQFVAEALEYLYIEVHEAGPQAMDFVQASMPKGTITTGHEPRSIVAVTRLRDVSRLIERASEGLERKDVLAWGVVRIPRVWDDVRGWRGRTYKEAAGLLDVNRKTVAAMVSRMDEAVTRELEKLEWQI